MGIPENGMRTWLGIRLRTWFLSLLTVQFSTFILLLHYSRVMPVPDGHRYLPSSAVFLVELLKLAICLTLSLYEVSLAAPRSTSATSLFSTLGAAIFTGDSWQMAIPAFLYTLANSLQYIGITNLDAATFQVTYQLKIIVTAIFSVLILKRSLTSRQWISLLLLMVGVAIVSLPQADSSTLASTHHSRIYIPRSIESLRKELGVWSKEPYLMKRSATYEGIEQDEMALDQTGGSASAGFLAVIGVTVCSGLAGVYFEKLIKDSPKTPSLWIRNVQLSIYSMFPAFFIGVIFIDGEAVAKNGFFDGYNWIVVLSIVIQSLGGIVAAFCIYYADNISKNFAVSISMVLSSLASFFFFDFEATGNFLLGTSIVLVATCLYSMQEYGRPRPRPPLIRIHSYQNITIDKAANEKDDVSINLPKTPLKAEDSLTTSRPGTPNSKFKRKGEHLGYFTKPYN